MEGRQEGREGGRKERRKKIEVSSIHYRNYTCSSRDELGIAVLCFQGNSV
jgi:hypothetical protein